MSDKRHTDLDQPLEQLFAQAVQTEPVLESASFASAVVANLPKRRVTVLQGSRRGSRRGTIFADIAGLAVGLILILFFIDFSALSQWMTGLIPEEIVVSISHVLIATALMSALAVAAWAKLEKPDWA